MDAEVEAGTQRMCQIFPVTTLWDQICLACERLCCQDMALSRRESGEPCLLLFLATACVSTIGTCPHHMWDLLPAISVWEVS